MGGAASGAGRWAMVGAAAAALVLAATFFAQAHVPHAWSLSPWLVLLAAVCALGVLALHALRLRALVADGPGAPPFLAYAAASASLALVAVFVHPIAGFGVAVALLVAFRSRPRAAALAVASLLVLDVVVLALVHTLAEGASAGALVRVLLPRKPALVAFAASFAAACILLALPPARRALLGGARPSDAWAAARATAREFVAMWAGRRGAVALLATVVATAIALLPALAAPLARLAPTARGLVAANAAWRRDLTMTSALAPPSDPDRWLPADGTGVEIVVLAGALAVLLGAWAARGWPTRERPLAWGERELLPVAALLLALLPLRLWMLVNLTSLPYRVWDGLAHLGWMNRVLEGQLPSTLPLYHFLTAGAFLVIGNLGIITFNFTASLAAVAASYLLLCEAGVGRRAAWLACAVFGNVVVVAYASVTIGPDTLAMLLSALVLLTAAPILRGKAGALAWLTFVLVAAAALLTKVNTLVPVLVCVFVLLWSRRERVPPEAWVAGVVTLGAIAAWYVARRAGPLPGRGEGGAFFAAGDGAGWTTLLSSALWTPVGDFAILPCRLPLAPNTLAFALLLLVGLAALLLHQGRRHGRTRAAAWTAAGAFALLAWQATPCPIQWLAMGAGAAGAALAAVGAVRVARWGAKQERILLAVTIGMVALLGVFYAYTGYVQARHLLPGAAAFALLVVRGAQRGGAAARRHSGTRRRGL